MGVLRRQLQIVVIIIIMPLAYNYCNTDLHKLALLVTFDIDLLTQATVYSWISKQSYYIKSRHFSWPSKMTYISKCLSGLSKRIYLCKRFPRLSKLTYICRDLSTTL